MIDKRAPLPWVEGQHQPHRGAKENENGALGAELSPPHSYKTTETITTISRNLTVICLHRGEKVNKRNSAYHTKSTIKNTSSDRIQKSEATIERPGTAPSGAGLRKSVQLTLDAARRKKLPQTYRAFGRKRPLIPSRGTRRTAKKKTPRQKQKEPPQTVM